MENIKINYNGKMFLRETESIADDVVKVYWWEQTEDGDKEIYIQDDLDALENYYEVTTINNIVPELPII